MRPGLALVLVLMTCIMISVVFYRGMTFAGWTLDGIQEAGSFGDFFGGMLNPLLTFGAFVGLITSLEYQRQAKRSSDEQRLEAAFYQNLTILNDLVRDLRIIPLLEDEREVHGREVFVNFYKLVRHHYKQRSSTVIPDVDRIRFAFEHAYAEHPYLLGHYFRYLYNSFRFFHGAPEMSKDEKRRFSRLLRAQISDYELAVLLYNTQTKNGAKWAELAEAYRIFDNLPDNLLLDMAHKHLEGLGPIGDPSTKVPIVTPKE